MDIKKAPTNGSLNKTSSKNNTIISKKHIDHEQAVVDACLEWCGELPPVEKAVLRVGKWHRFQSRKSLVIKLYHADGGGYVYLIQDHVSGCFHKGCTDLLTDRAPMTAKERYQLKQKRLKQAAACQARAARKAVLLSGYVVNIWNKAMKPDSLPTLFEYLKQKGEPVAKNARFFKSHKRFVMLLPMVCPLDRVIKSLYLVSENGFKRPLKGTAMQGLCMAISDTDLFTEPVLWVTEGYATGLSLFNAMNQPVVVAFSSGNLLPVVRKLVAAYPQAQLKLCSDNDVDTLARRGFNPGIDAAKKVQGAFPHVEVFTPQFPEGATGLSDFNDLTQYLKRQGVQGGTLDE